MKSIFDDILDNKSISDEKLKEIQSSITVKKIGKGTFLLRKGEKSSKSYFVRRGCLRSYTIDEKGKEHIFMFAPEGWIINDFECTINDAPAQLFIDAIEDSEIEVLDMKFFIDSFKMQLNPNVAATKLTKRISVLQKRIIMLMSASLQERYLDFIQTYPEIVQRVPQKMVASYLGVTPEALSKIRSDLSKQK